MTVNLINTAGFSRSEFAAPLEKLTGLPNVAYNSSGFAEFERDEVLAKTWFCVTNQAPGEGAGALRMMIILF